MYAASHGKISCKILDTLQEKGQNMQALARYFFPGFFLALWLTTVSLDGIVRLSEYFQYIYYGDAF